MAKEGEVLKKIELNVCIECDRCKKKVKKDLQSVKGVLRTETNSQQQKVTVFGNVDSWVLIARFSRVGKQVEAWTQNAVSTNNKESDQIPKEKSNDKQSSTNAFATKEVIKEPVATANRKENKDKIPKRILRSQYSFMPMPPTLLQGDPNQKASGNQYIYMLQAQPMGIPVLQSPQIMPNMPYFAVCSYVAPEPTAINPTCYPQQNYAVRVSDAIEPSRGLLQRRKHCGMPCDVKGFRNTATQLTLTF